ncbi:prepilin peptidase [Enterobacter asburiae]|uniref:prepilin peptidase n=1 Tax=Enterobacter asburiae TaxID=61645 RepID=UPI00064B41B8|nr:A24 family peptidase [Enterobacter asburiae]CAE7068899.1 Type 4 prepilin-like proteins leader peptide-processing enzyme [Enterobacter cloacae]AKL00739.1 general secretion pathway protein GspO [Enterobacter asburiae]ELP5719402.1 prepilin peptidase [Enterobacter asburiae]MCU3441939.1 A24 family peptidase [Enterobacter asburiae]MEB2407471.1 A24 family peptidase [Enterobacter asburiae]
MNPLMLLQQANLPGLCVMSGALGAILGSFLGVVAERIPPLVMEEEGAGNLLFPASHCPDCHHALSAWENIPIISWCALRGRCRHCHSAIPLRLLLVEVCSALFFAASAMLAPSFTALIALWLMWSLLLPLVVIDARHMLLPDCLTQPLLWTGLMFHALFRTLPLTEAIYGAVAGYLSLWLVYWAFRLLTGREGLGYGDFKLLAALGAWCGWQALPSIVLIAALGGIIMHCLLKPFENKNNLISFGPYIAFSGLVVFIAKIPHIMF